MTTPTPATAAAAAMTVTLYEVSITTFQKALKALGHILKKANDYAVERGEDPNVYAKAALVADMQPLSFQVQVVSNTIKKCVWRLTGVDVGAWPDNETTLAALQARVQKTIDMLNRVEPAALAGKEDALVDLQMSGTALTIPGKAYVLTYAVPNVFFHLQTTYSILRMRGVPLGKMDYLNSFVN